MKKIIINQSTSSVEVVPASLIVKLYNLCNTESELDNSSSFTGNIRTTHSYWYMADKIRENFGRNLQIQIDDPYIHFEDPNVKDVIMLKGWNADNESITEYEASRHALGNTFWGNTQIQYFDEVKFFSKNSVLNLNGCTNLRSVNLDGYDGEVRMSYLNSFVNPTYFMGVNSTPGYLKTSMRGLINCPNLTYLELTDKCNEIMVDGYYNSYIETVKMLPKKGANFGARATGYSNMESDPSHKLTSLYVKNIENFWSCTFGLGAFFTDVTDLYVLDLNTNQYVKTTEVTVPYGTTAILQGVWYKAKKITSIDWNGTQNDILSIGDNAFGSSGIYFGNLQFNNCTTIGRNAFSECDVSNIIIPSAISIGSHAFDGSSITLLHISSNLLSCGEFAFANCNSLNAVYFDGTIEDWFNISFSDYTSNLYIASSASNPVYRGSGASNNTVFYLKGSSNDSNYSVLTQVDLIGKTQVRDYALSGCQQLTTVLNTNSLNSIGVYAFAGCKALTQISIPNTVTAIGRGAFEYCTGLTSFTIPNSIEVVNARTFCHCERLASINLDNIRRIDEWAFDTGSTSGVTTLDNVDLSIPNLEGTLGNYAFRGTKIKSVLNLGNVQIIGELAFANCSNLQTVAIPSSVQKIKKVAFNNCSNLTTVIVNATTPPEIIKHDEYGVFGIPGSSVLRIYVPNASYTAYITPADQGQPDNLWVEYASNIHPISELPQS